MGQEGVPVAPLGGRAPDPHRRTSDSNDDCIFGQYSSQREVFTSMVAPVVDEVMQGFNCTVFAYGQTGSGKTYTLDGTDKEPGILRRAVGDLFEIGTVLC